jgi:hypothetical protein
VIGSGRGGGAPLVELPTAGGKGIMFSGCAPFGLYPPVCARGRDSRLPEEVGSAGITTGSDGR